MSLLGIKSKLEDWSTKWSTCPQGRAGHSKCLTRTCFPWDWRPLLEASRLLGNSGMISRLHICTELKKKKARVISRHPSFGKVYHETCSMCSLTEGLVLQHYCTISHLHHKAIILNVMVQTDLACLSCLPWHSHVWAELIAIIGIEAFFPSVAVACSRKQ